MRLGKSGWYFRECLRSHRTSVAMAEALELEAGGRVRSRGPDALDLVRQRPHLRCNTAPLTSGVPMR